MYLTNGAAAGNSASGNTGLERGPGYASAGHQIGGGQPARDQGYTPRGIGFDTGASATAGREPTSSGSPASGRTIGERTVNPAGGNESTQTGARGQAIGEQSAVSAQGQRPDTSRQTGLSGRLDLSSPRASTAGTSSQDNPYAPPSSVGSARVNDAGSLANLDGSVNWDVFDAQTADVIQQRQSAHGKGVNEVRDERSAADLSEAIRAAVIKRVKDNGSRFTLKPEDDPIYRAVVEMGDGEFTEKELESLERALPFLVFTSSSAGGIAGGDRNLPVQVERNWHSDGDIVYLNVPVGGVFTKAPNDLELFLAVSPSEDGLYKIREAHAVHGDILGERELRYKLLGTETSPDGEVMQILYFHEMNGHVIAMQNLAVNATGRRTESAESGVAQAVQVALAVPAKAEAGASKAEAFASLTPFQQVRARLEKDGVKLETGAAVAFPRSMLDRERHSSVNAFFMQRNINIVERNSWDDIDPDRLPIAVVGPPDAIRGTTVREVLYEETTQPPTLSFEIFTPQHGRKVVTFDVDRFSGLLIDQRKRDGYSIGPDKRGYGIIVVQVDNRGGITTHPALLTDDWQSRLGAVPQQPGGFAEAPRAITSINIPGYQPESLAEVRELVEGGKRMGKGSDGIWRGAHDAVTGISAAVEDGAVTVYFHGFDPYFTPFLGGKQTPITEWFNVPGQDAADRATLALRLDESSGRLAITPTVFGADGAVREQNPPDQRQMTEIGDSIKARILGLLKQSHPLAEVRTQVQKPSGRVSQPEGGRQVVREESSSVHDEIRRVGREIEENRRLLAIAEKDEYNATYAAGLRSLIEAGTTQLARLKEQEALVAASRGSMGGVESGTARAEELAERKKAYFTQFMQDQQELERMARWDYRSQDKLKEAMAIRRRALVVHMVEVAEQDILAGQPQNQVPQREGFKAVILEDSLEKLQRKKRAAEMVESNLPAYFSALTGIPESWKRKEYEEQLYIVQTMIGEANFAREREIGDRAYKVQTAQEQKEAEKDTRDEAKRKRSEHYERTQGRKLKAKSRR
jgi:hypothetical protein